MTKTFTTIRDTFKHKLSITNYPGQYGTDHLLERFIDLCLALDKHGITITSAKRSSYGDIAFHVKGMGNFFDLFLVKGMYVLDDYYEFVEHLGDGMTPILNKLAIGPELD